MYGTSLQANAWLTPKLLVKEQPSLAKSGAQLPEMRGIGAHDVCQGAIIITGERNSMCLSCSVPITKIRSPR